MKRLVFLTGHFPDQKRRNSMLWVTDHLQAMGWHVTFVTVGYSWLSLLRGDRRIAALGKRPRTGTHRISPSLTHMFGYSPVHPVRTGRRLLDRVLAALGPLYTSYWRRRLRGPLSKADLVIVESGPPVALAAMAAQLAPDAVRLYRVSDDIRLLNAPEALLRAERAHHHFNRISTGSAVIAKRFAEHPNVTVDPMGVPHDAVRIDTKDPYNRGGGPIAVCAGSTQLDMGQIRKVAQEAPNWQIHVIGRLKGTPPDLPNVTWHGELPFDQTLAFVQHADIGLAPFQDVPGVEYQITSSNRILLYRFHGLPILVPPRLCACSELRRAGGDREASKGRRETSRRIPTKSRTPAV